MQQDFLDHLGSFQGGDIDPERLKKHECNIKTVLNKLPNPLLDECKDSIPKLLEEKYTAQSKAWKPNTIRAYINSFQKLLEFAINRRDLYNIAPLKELSKTLQSVSANMEKKARQIQKTQKRKQAFDAQVLSPDDFKVYFDSDRSKEALRLLQNFSDEERTRGNHTHVRNYILMSMLVANPHRTACFVNITVEDFLDASQKNGNRIIYVDEHKTRSTYGAADLVVDEKLYSMLQVYKDQVRPINSCEKLIVTWNGTGMDAGGMASALSKELLNAGIDKKLVYFKYLCIFVSVLFERPYCRLLIQLPAHMLNPRIRLPSL